MKGFIKFSHELREHADFRRLSTNARYLYICLLAKYNIKTQIPIKITIRDMIKFTDMSSGGVQAAIEEILQIPKLLTKTTTKNGFIYDMPLIKEIENQPKDGAREFSTRLPKNSGISRQREKPKESAREFSTQVRGNLAHSSAREFSTQVRGNLAHDFADNRMSRQEYEALRTKERLKEHQEMLEILKKEDEKRGIVHK